MSLLLRQPARRIQRLQPGLAGGRQESGKGAIAPGLLERMDTNGFHSGRKLPVCEGKAMTQSAGPCLHKAQITPGLADQLAAPEPALMPGHKLAACRNTDHICADANRDRLANPFGRNAVTVAVTGTRQVLETPRGCSTWASNGMLMGCGNRCSNAKIPAIAASCAGWRRARFPAAWRKPGIQRRKIRRPGRQRDQPLTRVAGLIPDLALLPARSWRAGRRLK